MERRSLLDAFDDEFTTQLKRARTNPEAYEKAAERFEQLHGFTAFDSYDSFRKKKGRKKR